MSSGEEGQERTEAPTAKRLQDARDKGQVARSRELSTMMVMLSCAAMLLMLGDSLGHGFMTLLREALSPAFLNRSGSQDLPAAFMGVLVDGLWLTWPLMAVSFVAAILASVMLGGVTFSLSFKLEKLNPVTGLARLFSLQSGVELLKSVAKVVFIGGVAWVLLQQLSDDILGLSLQTADAAIASSARLMLWFLLAVSLPLLLIAFMDVPWQLWNHHKQLRMTRQEVIDEHKESEGRPEVKQKIRALQQAAARQRMMSQVPTADVIITNPTHYAVALRYDLRQGKAPILVAKGIDEVAARIRELGNASRVPLVASPMLARAVYASCDLDQEIPSGLYLAVAQILTYVYQLKQWQDLGGDMPEAPQPHVDEQFLKGHAMTPPSAQDEPT